MGQPVVHFEVIGKDGGSASAASESFFEQGGLGIIAERVYFDLYTFLQQLGLLEVAAAAQFRYPANGGIPIDNDSGSKPVYPS